MGNPKVCILSSGGIDSTLLIHQALSLGHEVYPLYIAAGFIWEEAEQHFLKQWLQEFSTERLKPLQLFQTNLEPLLPDNHWAYTDKGIPDFHSADEEVYLPGRNLYLLTHAALYCQTMNLEEIWIGLLKSNPFPDAQPQFLSDLEKSFQTGLKIPLQIKIPFAKINKQELVEQYNSLSYALTFSCMNPKGFKPCHACNKCAERKKILKSTEEDSHAHI